VRNNSIKLLLRASGSQPGCRGTLGCREIFKDMNKNSNIQGQRTKNMHRYQKLYMSFNFRVLTQFSKEFEASNDALSMPFITAHVGIIPVQKCCTGK